ncbi:cupin domain-containing protein [soil metagenome]
MHPQESIGIVRAVRLAACICACLAAGAAAALESPAEIGVADPGPQQHLTYRADGIEWRPGPGSLAAGARMSLLEGDPTAPGVFTMRIHLPDGFRIAPHWHPKPERVTVLSGTFLLGAGETMDPDKTQALEAGAYTAMPPGMRHFAIARGDTVIQLTSTGPWQITYVDPSDDPRRREPNEVD